jgi:hypothetical protein
MQMCRRHGNRVHRWQRGSWHRSHCISPECQVRRQRKHEYAENSPPDIWEASGPHRIIVLGRVVLGFIMLEVTRDGFLLVLGHGEDIAESTSAVDHLLASTLGCKYRRVGVYLSGADCLTKSVI